MLSILSNPTDETWQHIRSMLWSRFSASLPIKGVEKEIVRRDRDLAELDNLLAGAAWNLWQDFTSSLSKGSDGVIEFWNTTSRSHTPEGKAVLILDGLSLREIPLLLVEAEKRRFNIHQSGAWAAEIPGMTTQFANALGFSQRSALENNGAASKRFPGAWTESCNISFHDCAGMIPPEKSILFWHHWPDSKMHELAGPGLGLEALAKEVSEKLTSDDFWSFIEQLSTGRKLLITSDHGYAATGHFPDLQDKNQVESLKTIFKAQRFAEQTFNNEPLPWIPPIDWPLITSHGPYRLILGRRKWKCQGGYPLLQHGGLSLLEMFVPFLEIGR